MLIVTPGFYDRFSCIASRCAHSCCVGWEIDVDAKTRSFYASVPGKLGEELASVISRGPEPHFILQEGERCPFLRKDGLCRIILDLGKDALCDICREHPRFYNRFPGREERGLGLCCEEALRLLLSEKDFSLTEKNDGKEEGRDLWREELAALRANIFDIMKERNCSFLSRLEKAFALLGETSPAFESKQWAASFLTLERMDDSWTGMLQKLTCDRGGKLDGQLKDTRYEKLFCYLIYRHFISADDLEQARDLLFFCAIGTLLVAALDRAEPTLCDEHIRLFSAEIEYSDENVGKICTMRRQSFDFNSGI